MELKAHKVRVTYVFLFLNLNVLVAGAKDYFKMTVWPFQGTSWDYPICSETLNVNYDIAYIHISHPYYSQFTDYAPCNCKLYASQSTDVEDIRVHLTNNSATSKRHTYTYGDWHRTDKDGMFRFSIVAHASYTMLNIYLNEHVQRYSLYNQRSITFSIDGGRMGLTCSNGNFTSALITSSSTSSITPTTTRLSTTHTSTTIKTSTTSQLSKTTTTITSFHVFRSTVFPQTTLNISIRMGSSSDNSGRDPDRTVDLPIILGSIAAIISLFIIMVLIFIVIVARRRIINWCTVETKPIKKKDQKQYMHAVTYHNGEEKVFEHNLIYTDCDKYMSNGLQNGGNKYKSINNDNRQLDILTVSRNQDLSRCITDKVINNHFQNHGNTEKKLDNKHTAITSVPNEAVKDDTHSVGSSSENISEDDAQCDDSLMAQFLQELNKKLPVLHKDNSSSQDNNIHSVRSTLPPQNTFRNANDPIFQEFQNNLDTNKRKTLPVKLNMMPANEFMANDPINANHVYANVGQNRNTISNDTGSHYAQIDLTSLVKPEIIPQRKGENYNVVYAELDLRKK